jgi:hypothetical protein
MRAMLRQSGEQYADLVAGQRDQLVVAQLTAARLGRGEDGQERVGERGQDGLAVTGRPAADVVLVQRGGLLAGDAVEGVLAVADPAADQRPESRPQDSLRTCQNTQI